MFHGSGDTYGGPAFEAAAALDVGGGMASPARMARVVARMLRDPRRGAAMFGVLRATRPLAVTLTDSPEGEALRAYFDQRYAGVIPQNRWCRGVLTVPVEYGQHLRGRRRQALRTNLRRAAARGIETTIERDPARFLDAVWAVCGARTPVAPAPVRRLREPSWIDLLAEPGLTRFVARGADGTVLAVAAVVIDAQVALTRFALACDHDARWALHDAVVRALVERRVAYALAEGGGPFGVLGFPPEIRYFQRLHGYELRHVLPVPLPHGAVVPEPAVAR